MMVLKLVKYIKYEIFLMEIQKLHEYFKNFGRTSKI